VSAVAQQGISRKATTVPIIERRSSINPAISSSQVIRRVCRGCDGAWVRLAGEVLRSWQMTLRFAFLLAIVLIGAVVLGIAR
jgi:hypothetical protein